MTGEGVKLTAGIRFLIAGAFEFTFRRETEISPSIILKANVFYGFRKGVAGRVNRRISADENVSFDIGIGRITRERRIPFADAIAEDAVTLFVAVRDVVSVDEAGRDFAVQRHDVPALEVSVVTYLDVGVFGHGQESIADSSEQIVRDRDPVRVLGSVGRVFA